MKSEVNSKLLKPRVNTLKLSHQRVAEILLRSPATGSQPYLLATAEADPVRARDCLAVSQSVIEIAAGCRRVGERGFSVFSNFLENV